MTPRELAREQEAANRRAQADTERDIARAWFTGRFCGIAARGGTLPDLKPLLERLRRERQDFEQMKAQLHTLSQLTGFPVREVVHG